LPAFYSPDFLVRAAGSIYLVETKAQGQLTSPNVLRKRKAACGVSRWSASQKLPLPTYPVGQVPVRWMRSRPSLVGVG
jgi:hypothetical protein